MKHRNNVQKVSKNTHGLALILERVISGICLIVLLASPLSPIFASEIVSEVSPEGQSTEEQGGEGGESVDVPEEEESITDTNTEVSDTQTSTETEESESGTPVNESIQPLSSEASSEEDVSGDSSQSNIDSIVNPDLSPSTEPTIDLPQTNAEEHTSGEVTATTSTTVEEDEDELVIPNTEEDQTVENATSTEEHKSEEQTEEETSENIEEEATSTEASDLSVVFVENDVSAYSFNKDECVVTGGDSNTGTFFCTKSTEKTVPVFTDGVYSAQDADGDKEIYIQEGGESIVVTNNAVDDDAPQFDSISNTLVWHRLVDNRYQIISYDIETNEEVQLTFDRYNNMQPARFDETTVWQGWVGEDWEIFMLQGDELTMVTDNVTQDIDPSINETHIVWQAFEANVWKMKVYDIRSKKIDTIEDADGGSIENPRFVLVYDTKLESGDIETKGYDVKSGEVVPLSATPAPLPENIPDPDQTGEDRALVTPPVQLKTKIDGESDPEPQNDPELPPLDATDVVVPPVATSTTMGSVDGISAMANGESDLIISPLHELATTSVSHIEDVIVTPYVEPIIETSDSQEPIAPTE